MTFGPDPVRDEVRRALETLDAGGKPHESLHVDLKEEVGRRAKDGLILPVARENEVAARALASECACMANTPGGGALLVGARDDGTVIGTELDVQWLRHRLYELLNRQLTVEIVEAWVNDRRLLIIFSPQSDEPIQHNGRIHWRVKDHCAEVDASTWHTRLRQGPRFDWSAQYHQYLK